MLTRPTAPAGTTSQSSCGCVPASEEERISSPAALQPPESAARLPKAFAQSTHSTLHIPHSELRTPHSALPHVFPQRYPGARGPRLATRTDPDPAGAGCAADGAGAVAYRCPGIPTA